MRLFTTYTIRTKTYFLIGLSVFTALLVLYVSSTGFRIIKTHVDELIRANSIERHTYQTILEEKNYLLNSNGSITNKNAAAAAFNNAKEALASIHKTLDELERTSPDAATAKRADAVRKAIASYDELYKRSVFLLKELEDARLTLQREGDNITLQIQEYVEAKRTEAREELSQHTLEKINCGSNIWQYTYMSRADEKRYLLSPDPLLVHDFDNDYSFMMSELNRLKSLSDQPFEHEKINNFEVSAIQYQKAMQAWIGYNDELSHVLLPKTRELGERVIEETLKIADNSVHDINAKRAVVLTTLLIVTLLAVIFGLLFGTFISRSINSSIQTFQTGLLDFFKYLDRRQNSARQIPIEGEDEIAAMATVVNENILKIEEVMEQKLQQMDEQNRQMIRQSRLAQMGEMISMIAHQWRQPLGAVSATASDIEVKLFERRLFDLSTSQGQQEMEAYTRTNLHKISEYVHHLSKTIDDFRNFFKPDKEKSSFLLQDVAEKTLNLSGHLLRTRGIEVLRSYDPDLGKLYSFENEIMQVLLNIIHNAVDAFGANRVEKPRISISIFKNRLGNQSISIQDNAGGIPAAILEKIFDPYFSTKGKNGTGLGLYMSQTIIEEHCKGIMSATNFDGGAMFIIEFPNEAPSHD